MKYWLTGLAFIVALIPFSVSSINPETMTDAEKQRVVNQCHDIKRNLQSLKHVDTIARVSRGTTTTNLVTLMSAFNSRAASNTYNIPSLVTATNNVQDLRREFADDYTQYEIGLRDLILIDCKSEPMAFYQKLIDVRAKRALLNAAIKEIESQLDSFQSHTTEVLIKIRGGQ